MRRARCGRAGGVPVEVDEAAAVPAVRQAQVADHAPEVLVGEHVVVDLAVHPQVAPAGGVTGAGGEGRRRRRRRRLRRRAGCVGFENGAVEAGGGGEGRGRPEESVDEVAKHRT